MFIVGIIIPRQTTGTSANPIFLFQKSNRFLLIVSFHEILIDAESSVLIAASSAKGIVNFILRDEILLLYLQCIRHRKFQFFPVKVCNL